jgi:hypothetical protein
MGYLTIVGWDKSFKPTLTFYWLNNFSQRKMGTKNNQISNLI